MRVGILCAAAIAGLLATLPVSAQEDARVDDVEGLLARADFDAAEMAAGIRGPDTRIHYLTSVIKAMARFFWFTIEFGLMRGRDGLKVYGSGLLSSHGEIAHAIEDPEVQRYPIQLEWAINQGFEINHYQPLLFIVDSFDHLFSLVDQLEAWMKDGKLSNVAPGEPEVNEEDLKSFLHAELD